MTETTLLKPPPVGLAMRTLLRADATVLLRNRQALLLSIVLPVAMLFITGAGGGRRQVLDPGYLIGLAITYGLMASGLFGYPMAVARDRESGVFQRMRVTPVPMWTVSVSRIVVQLVLSLVMSLVVLALGGVRHHLTFGVSNWLLVLVISLLGALVFLAIGQAIVGLTTTSGQVNAFSRVLFALLLVVGLVGSSGLLGTTFKTIAGWTPVGGLSNLFSAATGSVAWGSDQVIGLVASVGYAVVFGFIGVRWFRWTVR